MNSKVLCLFLFRALILNAENFYVSEIFLNNKTQWLELTNISERAIIIKNLKLETKIGDKDLKVIESPIHPPAIFDDRLIIANQKDLGLGACLNQHINIIALSDFHINKKLKICVSINQEKATCLNLASIAHFNDGASLYRSLENLWRFEPCSLIPGIYATPGLPEQACLLDPDFAKDILSDCVKPSAYYSQAQNFTDNLGKKPYLSLAQLDNNLNIELKDDDLSDLWRLSFCASPADSKLICQELSEPFSMSPAQNKDIKIPALYQKQSDEKLSINVRDLYDLSNSAEIVFESPKSIINYQLNQIPKTLKSLGNDRFLLDLTLELQHVPTNAQILSLSGEILAQKAFVSAGIHQLTFITKDSTLRLNLASKSHNYFTDMSIKHERQKSSSCQSHDANFFLSLLIYFWLIFKRK